MKLVECFAAKVLHPQPLESWLHLHFLCTQEFSILRRTLGPPTSMLLYCLISALMDHTLK